MAGDEQQRGDTGELGAAHILRARAQHPEHVLARLGAPRSTSPPMLARHSSATGARSASGRPQVDLCGSAVELGAVGVRHPEQLADDEARHRQREPRHQVGGRRGAAIASRW